MFKIGVAFYFIYLLPYLLISHEIRYQYILIPVQALFYFLLIEFLLDSLNASMVKSAHKRRISKIIAKILEKLNSILGYQSQPYSEIEKK